MLLIAPFNTTRDLRKYCYKITIMFCHFAIYSPISKYSCCLIKWDFVCLGVAIVARVSHITVNTALCKYQAERRLMSLDYANQASQSSENSAGLQIPLMVGRNFINPPAQCRGSAMVNSDLLRLSNLCST